MNPQNGVSRLDLMFKEMKRGIRQRQAPLGSIQRPRPSTESGIDKEASIIAATIRNERDQGKKELIQMYAIQVEVDTWGNRCQTSKNNAASKMIYEWNDKHIINDRILNWHRWRRHAYPNESIIDKNVSMTTTQTGIDVYHRCNQTCSGIYRTSLLGVIPTNNSSVAPLVGCVKSGLIHLCRASGSNCHSTHLSADKYLVCVASGHICISDGLQNGYNPEEQANDFGAGGTKSNHGQGFSDMGGGTEGHSYIPSDSSLMDFNDMDVMNPGFGDTGSMLGMDKSVVSASNPENIRRIAAIKLNKTSLVALNVGRGTAIIDLSDLAQPDFSWMWMMIDPYTGKPKEFPVWVTQQSIKNNHDGANGSLMQDVIDKLMQRGDYDPNKPKPKPTRLNMLCMEKERAAKKRNRKRRRDRAKGRFSVASSDMGNKTRLQATTTNDDRVVIEAVLDDILWDSRRRRDVNDTRCLETADDLHVLVREATLHDLCVPRQDTGMSQKIANTTINSVLGSIQLLCQQLHVGDVDTTSQKPSAEPKKKDTCLSGIVPNIHQLSCLVHHNLKKNGIVPISEKQTVRHLALTEAILYLWTFVTKPILAQLSLARRKKAEILISSSSSAPTPHKKKDPNGKKPSLFQFILGFLYAAAERDICMGDVLLWPRDWWLNNHLPQPRDLCQYGTLRNQARWQSRFLTPKNNYYGQADRVEALAHSFERIRLHGLPNLHSPNVYSSPYLTIGEKSMATTLLNYSINTKGPKPQRIAQDMRKQWIKILLQQSDLNPEYAPVGAFWFKQQNLTPTPAQKTLNKKKRHKNGIKPIQSYRNGETEHQKPKIDFRTKTFNCTSSAGFYASLPLMQTAAIKSIIYCCLYYIRINRNNIHLHIHMRNDISDMSHMPQQGIPSHLKWTLDTAIGPFYTKHDAFLFLAHWSHGSMDLNMRRMAGIALAKKHSNLIVWRDESSTAAAATITPKQTSISDREIFFGTPNPTPIPTHATATILNGGFRQNTAPPPPPQLKPMRLRTSNSPLFYRKQDVFSKWKHL